MALWRWSFQLESGVYMLRDAKVAVETPQCLEGGREQIPLTALPTPQFESLGSSLRECISVVLIHHCVLSFRQQPRILKMMIFTSQLWSLLRNSATLGDVKARHQEILT